MTAVGSRMQLNFSYRTNAAEQQSRSDDSIERCDQSEKRDRECSRRRMNFIDERSEYLALLARLFKDKYKHGLHVEDQVEDIGEKWDIADDESTSFQIRSEKRFYARHFNELYSFSTEIPRETIQTHSITKSNALCLLAAKNLMKNWME